MQKAFPLPLKIIDQEYDYFRHPFRIHDEHVIYFKLASELVVMAGSVKNVAKSTKLSNVINYYSCLCISFPVTLVDHVKTKTVSGLGFGRFGEWSTTIKNKTRD